MKDVYVYSEVTNTDIARFETVAEAEEFIANLPDQEAVLAGHYGIDAPELKVNPKPNG